MQRIGSRPHILVIVLVAALVVAACAPTANTPTSPLPPSPTKTAKPTFTPLPDHPVKPAEAAATQPKNPTAPSAPAPTLAPTITERPDEPPTEQPTDTPATATPPPAQSLHMESPEYGMQIFPWWRPEVASRDFQVVAAAGFGWAKVNFGWREIEGAGKGIFDWSRTDDIVRMAQENGIDLVVRVDHQPAWAGGGFPVNGPPDNLQDIADFFTALATRYRGRIRAYQVWNEPNLAREWGGRVPDPAAYAQMLLTCYQAIKAADPNAMVISAGLSPTGTWNDQARPDDWYLETLYIVMGSSDGYFDVLGAHAPGFKSPPERDPAEVAANPDLGGHRAFCFRRVEDLRAIMVKYGDADKQVAVLEFGWTSDPRPDSPYNWHAVSEQTKAEYFIRAYQYAKQNWSPWIGLMSLIYICDHDWTPDDEQYWWAISDPGWPEFQPRPAYTALKEMPK